MLLGLGYCSACGVVSDRRRPSKFDEGRLLDISRSAPQSLVFQNFSVKKSSGIATLARIYGVPVGVMAVVNGRQRHAVVTTGTSVRVPRDRDLYPVFRSEVSGHSATSASLDYLIRIGVLSPSTIRLAIGEFRRKAGALLWPVLGGEPGSPFGERWGRPHRGVDIPAPENTPVFAAHDGEIVVSKYSGAYGNLLVIRRGSIETRYAHLGKMFVSKGEEVSAGDVIGSVGTTGRVTGSHLHFEVAHQFSDGRYYRIDPILFFTAPSVLLAFEQSPLPIRSL